MRGAGSNGDDVPEGGFGRTVMVVSHDAELAVALRDRLDRAYVTVCEVRPDEAIAAVTGCRPWPWMLVGTGTDVPAGLVDALRERPVLLLWRGAHPPGLPAHTRAMELFSAVAETAVRAVNAAAGGMRLAPGAGVTMPDARHVANPALDALVASHPHPLYAPARHFRGVSRVLERHRVPLRLARTGAGGAHLVGERV